MVGGGVVGINGTNRYQERNIEFRLIIKADNETKDG